MRNDWDKLFRLIPGYDIVGTAAGCTFHPDIADNACRFFEEHLVHIEGVKADTPLTLEPWQKAIVGGAFGWKRPDGSRRFREVFQYVPRKNGKSTLCGGLVNLVAFCDGEPGAQLYSAASEREQAALVYRYASEMIIRNPTLETRATCRRTYKSIEFDGGTFFKSLSAEAESKHGFNTHFVVVDELHAHDSRDLVDVLMTSTGARRQPMVWHITTADYDRESICNEKYDYACKVRDGVIEDSSFLPVIFEAPAEMDWTSPEAWRIANPNLGVSISEEYLARECKRAQDVPAYENTFRRLHLNQRTQQDVRWLSLDKWDRCNGAVDEGELAGQSCWVGLDLSARQDITAAVMAFRRGDRFVIVPRFWVPEDGAHERERRDKVPYITWARQGLVRLTPGNVTDYDLVREDLRNLAKRFKIEEIAVDPWNSVQIATQLQSDGFNLVEFRQGYASMSSPMQELERLVLGWKLDHGGNPILRWMAGNVAVEMDPAGNIKPSKRKSTERIDGIVAAIMAIGRAMPGITNGPSVYTDRGLVCL